MNVEEIKKEIESKKESINDLLKKKNYHSNELAVIEREIVESVGAIKALNGILPKENKNVTKKK